MPTVTSYLPRVKDKSASPSPLGSLTCPASSLENTGTKHCIRKLALHPLKQGTKPPQRASPCTPTVPCTHCEAETPSRYWQGPAWLQLISKWCSQSCWAGAVPVPAVRRSGVPFWRRRSCKQQVKGVVEQRGAGETKDKNQIAHQVHPRPVPTQLGHPFSLRHCSTGGSAELFRLISLLAELV